MSNMVLKSLQTIALGAVVLFSSPVLAQSFLVDYSTRTWTGGSIDSDSDSLPDYCLVVPRNPSKNYMMFAMTTNGLILMLVNPLWGMDNTGSSIEVDIVIEGLWQGKLNGQISNTQTVTVIVKGNPVLVDAIKSGNYLHAYTYIGDFSTQLSGTSAALQKSEQCFAQEIRPRMTRAPATRETTQDNVATPHVSASYQSGKAAYDNKDYITAMALWQEAAMSGDAEAINGLGILSRYGRGVPKDLQQARSWYLMAAEKGLDRAQYNLGRLYDKGLGVGIDYATALKWYLKAADQGYDRAQLVIGTKYIRGEGVPKNAEMARKWYLLAAQNGNRAAQFNLATLLRKGRGGTADPASAVQWYYRSAVQGFALAQLRLGDALASGTGVQVDQTEAYKWYLLAQKNGNEKAATKIDALGPLLSQADILQASNMASTWQKESEPKSRNTVAEPITAPPVIASAPTTATTIPAPAVTASLYPSATKKLPDDLFPDEPRAPVNPTPEPAASLSQLEGCYDLSQADAICQQACTSTEFTGKLKGSHLAYKQGASAPLEYCQNGCAQAKAEFPQSIAFVKDLAGSKFYCPMLYVETIRIARKNRIKREQGDKSALRAYEWGSKAWREATKIEVSDDFLGQLSTTPYPPAVQALVDQMPTRMGSCYSLEGTGAMDYCQAECIEDGKVLEMCNSGCEKGAALFRDSFIWTKGLTFKEGHGSICDAIQFTDKDHALVQVKNEARMQGLSREETISFVHGILNFWGGALTQGNR